ncbi:hypothetical protein L1887_12322 [Cichorium endivia]|nr:hypothetical protein L1887_12322 [Cichorium endivia]
MIYDTLAYDSDNETLAQYQERTKKLQNFSKEETTVKASTSNTTTSGVKRKRQDRGIKRNDKKKTKKAKSTLTPFKGFRTSDILRSKSSSGQKIKMMAITKLTKKISSIKAKKPKRNDETKSNSNEPRARKRLRYAEEKPKKKLKGKKSEAQADKEDLIEMKDKMKRISRYECELTTKFWTYMQENPNDEEILNLKREFQSMFGIATYSDGDDDDHEDIPKAYDTDDDDQHSDKKNEDKEGDEDENDEDQDRNDNEVTPASSDDDDQQSDDEDDDIEDSDGDQQIHNENDHNDDVKDKENEDDENDDAKDDSSNGGANEDGDDVMNTETGDNVAGNQVNKETKENVGGDQMNTNTTTKVGQNEDVQDDMMNIEAINNVRDDSERDENNDGVQDEMMNKGEEEKEIVDKYMVNTKVDTSMYHAPSHVEKETEINQPSTETPQKKTPDFEKMTKDQQQKPNIEHQTDINNQITVPSTSSSGPAKKWTNYVPKFQVLLPITYDEYMGQVCDELVGLVKSGKVDKNNSSYTYVNHLEDDKKLEQVQPSLHTNKDIKLEQVSTTLTKQVDGYDGPSFDLKISQESQPDLDTNDEKIAEQLQSKLPKEDDDFDKPTIDLKLSQEFGIILDKLGAKPVDDEGKPVKIHLVNPNNEIDDKNEEETPLVKRLRKPSVYNNSPYYKKIVEVLDMVKPIEVTISNRLFALEGEIHHPVFETKDGMQVSRILMETMIPNTCVALNVIDIWIFILNHEEWLKTKHKPKKVYCNVIHLKKEDFDEDADLEALYKIFEDNTNNTLKKCKIKNLKKVDLVWTLS